MSVPLHNQALLEELRRQREQAFDQLAMCRAELAVARARLKALEDQVVEARAASERQPGTGASEPTEDNAA